MKHNFLILRWIEIQELPYDFFLGTFSVLFLSLTVLIYYSPLCRKRTWRNGELLLASILFYAWGEPVLILLLLGEIAINWLLGILIEAENLFVHCIDFGSWHFIRIQISHLYAKKPIPLF